MIMMVYIYIRQSSRNTRAEAGISEICAMFIIIFFYPPLQK